MTTRAWVLATALLALPGCKKEPAAPPVKPPAPAPAAAQVVKIDNAVASASGQSDPECLAPLALGTAQPVAIGGRKAELNGYRLTFADKKDGPVVFGVLGGINEDSGENLVNLRKYVEFFKAEGAEAIIVDGDTGESPASIARALVPLAETGLPVFVNMGNRECRGHFHEALATVQKTFTNVVNLSKVRHVDFSGVDLLSVPGYHDKRYIHCATGCQYFKQDLDALKPVAKAAAGAVLVVAHGPARGATAAALDAAAEAGNVGDPNLNELITEAGIPFAIFANIKEAGGRATNLDGTDVLKEDTFADKLYLNPGPADAVAWAMNDGTQSVGLAATLTVEGKRARYKLYRARPLSAEEKAAAAALAPPAVEEAAAKGAPSQH